MHICGPVKEEVDNLFRHVATDSIILSEDLYTLLQEDNTHTELDIDISELADMSPFIRCKVKKESMEYVNISAKGVLMKFLNLNI